MPRHQATLPRRRGRWPALALALALAAALPAPAAHANGRPPVTNGVFFRPGDNDSIYVRTTFGLLVSRDNGCSFRWTCEQNIGYGGMFDPKYAVAADGTLFATTFTGLRVSRDGGCSFTTATAELPVGTPGRIADLWVDALDIGPTGEIWVGTAESAKPNDIYRSTDGGVTFSSRGMLSSVIWWKSIVVAPSDATRVYAAGYQISNPAPAAHVLATTDGGQSWTESQLAGVRFGGTPVVTIGAVDAADPQHLYIVSVAANGAEGDRLYRSTDGGKTFTEVLATTMPISNVVVRDATTVLVAAGDGSFRSQDRGATFTPGPVSPHLACLGKRPDGSLLGCGPNWDPDFMAVGRSDDANQWQKIFRFIELAGPLACPAGTAGHDICDVQLWPGLQMQFGAKGTSCGATPDGPPEEPPKPGGCCDTGGGSPIGAALLGLLTTSAWIFRRRRAPDRARA
jgi:uncharacterized protein (TIGR03382 family)